MAAAVDMVMGVTTKGGRLRRKSLFFCEPNRRLEMKEAMCLSNK